MITWLKRNWALAVLILFVVFWGKSKFVSQNVGYRSGTLPISGGGSAGVMMQDSSSISAPSAKMMPYGRESAPTDNVSRMVIRDSSLSLQVTDVAAEVSAIETLAKGFGGYLVSSNLSRPESATNGSITVRVPEEKRSEAMAAFKKLAVKVVSESVNGNDVTDQYVDLSAQLAVLTKTKAKFEDILDKATRVEDLMNVQQQLVNIQQQIDSVIGQQKYYEQSAKLSLVSVYLSTDELALPYAPTNEWRPAVIFKEAVRSLIANIRGLGSLIIWGLVYLPILIPVGLVLWYLKRRV
ncbi:DUF4349 domain-containing protein [Candidatus Shapirobacteria bacterium]|nr:DUF4349 domain-containing protein [Candidatus Shapirobacteria bacterium]